MFIRPPHNQAQAASSACDKPWMVGSLKGPKLVTLATSLDLGGGPRPYPGKPR